MNKKWLLLMLIFPFTVAQAEVVEVDIHGMTCGFCVEGLQRELSVLPNVSAVDVSMKSKKVRIVSDGAELNLEEVKKAIIDAGFTPLEIRHVDSGKS